MNIYQVNPNATSSNSDVTVTWAQPEPEHGPLCRAQVRLWDSRVPGTNWFGNRLSDLRYWLWRWSR